MQQFNTTEQKMFWKGDQAYSKGDIVSRVILSLSKRYVGKNTLDVGAGSGALIKAFQEKYKSDKHIVGVDIAPKTKEIQYANCTDLPFEDGSFDTCFCTDLIEHLADPDLDKCLNEINRVLKLKGYGIFSTIADENLNDRTVTCPECGRKFHIRGHCQVFNEERIGSLFQSKGFKVVKIKTIKLHFIAMFKILARIFYFFHLDQLLGVKFLTDDLFFVVCKEGDIMNDSMGSL